MDDRYISPTKSRPDNPERIPPSKMEAIARGVQARFEETTGYAKKVTDETIRIAQSLGVANTEIERWVSYRRNNLAHETARLKTIKKMLNKTYSVGTLSADKPKSN